MIMGLQRGVWVRPGRCDNVNDSNCVEVYDTGYALLVRNSASPQGPQVRFTPDEWVAFVDAVKAGTYDRSA
jgi:hypothetical protein